MALRITKIQVEGDDLPCEDVPIGLPVSRHLKVDTLTMLGASFSKRSKMDCTLDERSDTKTSGCVEWLMMRRLNPVQGNDEKLFRVAYYGSCFEEDPFTASSILDMIESTQSSEIREVVIEVVKLVSRNGLSADLFSSQGKLYKWP